MKFHSILSRLLVLLVLVALLQVLSVLVALLLLVPDKSDRDYISDAATRWRFC
jgi:hypothetical protein